MRRELLKQAFVAGVAMGRGESITGFTIWYQDHVNPISKDVCDHDWEVCGENKVCTYPECGLEIPLLDD